MNRPLLVVTVACAALCAAPPARATFPVPTAGSTAMLEVGLPTLALGFALGAQPLQPRMGLRYDLGVHVLRGVGAVSWRSFDTGLVSGDLHAELGPLLTLWGLPAAGAVGGLAYQVGLDLTPVQLQLGPRVELAALFEPDDRWALRRSLLVDAAAGFGGPRVRAWLFAELGYTLPDRGRGATALRAGLIVQAPIAL